jgi:hypothetical protein
MLMMIVLDDGSFFLILLPLLLNLSVGILELC